MSNPPYPVYWAEQLGQNFRVIGGVSTTFYHYACGFCKATTDWTSLTRWRCESCFAENLSPTEPPIITTYPEPI